MHFYMSQASEVYSIFVEVYFRINKHAIQKFQTIIPEITFLRELLGNKLPSI